MNPEPAPAPQTEQTHPHWRPLACIALVLFAVASFVQSGSWLLATLSLGACLLLLLMPRRLARRARTPAARKSLPAGITCTEAGLTYTDDNGTRHHVAWIDVVEVSWSEPLYGPLGSNPYWTIATLASSFVVEDGWAAGAHDAFPQCLAQALPGFDAAVVDKARSAGYFRTDSPETLVCWTRQQAAAQAPHGVAAGG